MIDAHLNPTRLLEIPPPLNLREDLNMVIIEKCVTAFPIPDMAVKPRLLGGYDFPNQNGPEPIPYQDLMACKMYERIVATRRLISLLTNAA